jgi:hypothetical protein
MTSNPVLSVMQPLGAEIPDIFNIILEIDLHVNS